MNPVIKAFLFIAGSLILTTCSLPSKPDESGILDAEFTSFILATEDNPGLPVTVEGRMDGNSILLEYPGAFIPGFRWIPRFETEAESVEVDGQPQSSSVDIQEFGSPVDYILTAASGLTQKIRVELVLQPGWGDMGINPVQPAGTGVHNIRTGFHLDLNPFVICRTTAFDMEAYMLNLVEGSWTNYNGGATPSGVLKFDALSWNGQVWVVYETTTGQIFAESMVPPNFWSGGSFINGTTGTGDLHVFKGTEDKLYAAWIDDTAGSRTAVVWETADGITWSQVGSGLSSLHTDSFAAVSAGGSDLYGVCTFSENPGTLHYFEYDISANQWNMTQDGGSLNKEDGQIILDLFYDTDKKAPVVFTAVPDDSDPGFYEIRALYWSRSAGLWTNLNYIDPLTLRVGDVANIAIDWYENRPAVSAGTAVLTWKEGSWEYVNSDFTSDSPVLQSLSAGLLDTYMTAYTEDATGGELIVRYIQ